MARHGILTGVFLAAGLLLAFPLAAQQQDNAAPPPQNPPPAANQKKDQKKPSTAQQNPFPEAQSEAAAQKQQPEDESESPSAPAPQNPQNKRPTTADQNPFPEAQSEKAAHPDEQQNGAAPGESGNNGDFSSSHVKGLQAPEEGPSTAPPSAHGYNPGLAKSDTKVGIFYLQTGDFKGAYERFIEATQSDPGNAEAVYGLAESAWRLNKRDEALRNFRLYLSALPDGPHAKEIRKDMKKMGVEPPA